MILFFFSESINYLPACHYIATTNLRSDSAEKEIREVHGSFKTYYWVALNMRLLIILMKINSEL